MPRTQIYFGCCIEKWLKEKISYILCLGKLMGIEWEVKKKNNVKKKINAGVTVSLEVFDRKWNWRMPKKRGFLTPKRSSNSLTTVPQFSMLATTLPELFPYLIGFKVPWKKFYQWWGTVWRPSVREKKNTIRWTMLCGAKAIFFFLNLKHSFTYPI